MTDDEIIAVVQAHKEGKQIQVHDNIQGWLDCNHDGCPWNFGMFDYRVKPEPRKPREWWIDSNASNGPWAAWTFQPCYPKDSLNDRCLVHVREVIE